MVGSQVQIAVDSVIDLEFLIQLLHLFSKGQLSALTPYHRLVGDRPSITTATKSHILAGNALKELIQSIVLLGVIASSLPANINRSTHTFGLILLWVRIFLLINWFLTIFTKFDRSISVAAGDLRSKSRFRKYLIDGIGVTRRTICPLLWLVDTSQPRHDAFSNGFFQDFLEQMVITVFAKRVELFLLQGLNAFGLDPLLHLRSLLSQSGEWIDFNADPWRFHRERLS